MSSQSTFVPSESDYVYRHHANWRLKSLSRLDEVQESELSYTCPCSIDKATFEELKENILDLMAVAVKKTHAARSEELACINIDLFWVES